MTFTPQFLDEIRTRLPCSEVVGRRVKLGRKGREFAGLCPFHNEKTPSFWVNDEKGFYHCFGCGAHGDVIGFSMRIDNLSFPEAVEKLANEAGLELPRFTPQERERAKRQQTLHEVVEMACAWFEAQLKAPGGKPGLDYLTGRGLGPETIARFRLGYAPEGRENLKSALKAAGVPEALMLEAGLIVKPEDGREGFDFFRGRVMFPIMDRRGRAVAFGGRILGDGQPKYLNSRETPLFDKGRTLYALDKARAGVAGGAGRPPAELVVCEGYMDVIALHEAGFTGAVAPLGTAITETQIETLWKLAPEPVLCLDGDAAGQRAALRAAERVLPLLKAGFSLRFARLPPGDDPDTLVRRQGPEAFVELLTRARPLVDILWDAEAAGRPLDTPERRAGLERRLKERIARIEDRPVQQQYFNSLIRDRLWAAFRPGRRRQGPPAPLRTSSLVAPTNSEILVAVLINHPALAVEFCERLVQLDLHSDGLAQILKEILDFTAGAELDTEKLKSHLMAKEMMVSLPIGSWSNRNVETRPWAFAEPSADLAVARKGLDNLLRSFDEQRLEAEIVIAQKEWMETGSPELEARLNNLLQQLRHTRVSSPTTVDDEESFSQVSG